MEAAFKVVKVVGESDQSIEGAVKAALQTSADRVHGQTWLQVTDIRANTNDEGGIDRWQVTAEIAFKVDDSK